jgi:hypothetical protein
MNHDFDDDPLLAALAALPSPRPDAARAERIRVHLREQVDVSPPPRLQGRVAAFALAAYAVAYLGWSVDQSTQNRPGVAAAKRPAGRA